ncbi:MAG: excinuclease ABC subunit UvrA [Dehalococcoidia bacterium]|nr:excinuclease ABC subunit UvrA [Dehalococcoidia bacterium]
MADAIIVRGAREHNLKNIDVTIPRGKLVVITGVSGSGKSTLAFDTIYAEGQRRYVESLSAYARQFLGQMQKPDVDQIEGLSPAISIDQKGPGHNPRSTVGTVTEIYDYLRLLFARIGHPHCPSCGREIQRQTVQQIVDAVMALPAGSRIMVLAPLIRDRKGEHQQVFQDLRKSGFVRARVDGEVHDLSEQFELDRNRKHSIEAVVDRIVVSPGENEARLAESIETALKLGLGIVLVKVMDGDEMLFSEHFACVYCGISLGEIEPRTFSFNSPHGACPVCTGLGVKWEMDPNLVVPDRDLSVAEGAVAPWSRNGEMSVWYRSMLESVALRDGFELNTPLRELSENQIDTILYGDTRGPVLATYDGRNGLVQRYARFEGVIPNLERRFRETDSDAMRMEISRYMSSHPCPACGGKRLKPESLAVRIDGMNIMDVAAMSVRSALSWAETLPQHITPREMVIAVQVLKEIRSRLGFLSDIGLDYITLDRASSSLSGGEAQRIHLATQIGSGLTGVLYVCDEPTVGLHPADDSRLITTLERLRDLGNTVLVVEHDEAMMRAADHVIDIGPGAGKWGGQVVATGTIDDIMAWPDSSTGRYLSGRTVISTPSSRRPGNGQSIVVHGARENNLKGIDVTIPLGKFVCVTGVSGSGKSTLVNDVLYRRLARDLYRAKERPGGCDGIDGIANIDKVVDIDQSPIGRTPRSNPVTYTGTFTPIRELFAQVPEARARGYGPGRFSFNVKGGRCEACQGAGFVQIEMQFLSDVTVPCEVCAGRRYNREALDIKFKGKTIADVLDMTVDEALCFFENIPLVRRKLETLRDVGLGYITLGQPAPTLSGGEAQRVKLATELSKRSTGNTLYILDEPTTGLAFADVDCLLKVLQRLVDSGNTMLVIEHHIDVMKNADWILDLGPGAGDSGGWLVATGTPEDVSNDAESVTGRYLKAVLDRGECSASAT